MIRNIEGIVAGYDPGGNNCHGLALAEICNGRCTALVTNTLESADTVLNELASASKLLAIGIDTLAAWATGPSGWRAADMWLRARYVDSRASIVSPNGLYGSMGINGMAVMTSIRLLYPEVHVTETHPKVLFRVLTGAKYNYSGYAREMDQFLSGWLDFPVETRNDHEWDAAASVYAALCGLTGVWSHDLFEEKSRDTGRLIFPSGKAHYWWPE